MSAPRPNGPIQKANPTRTRRHICRRRKIGSSWYVRRTPTATLADRTLKDPTLIAAIDGHQHFWDPARVPLPWLRSEHAAIARAFDPDELEPQLVASNVGATILVQSACSDEDTDLMFEHARRHDWIAGVVAWLPLEDPDLAAARLQQLQAEPKLRGVRHLIHDEADPHWILQPAVLESLTLLESAGLVLELPAVFPRHLIDVPELARRYRTLTIVIDHLGKPPIGRPELRDWSTQLTEAASYPNVAAKISGLNTTLDHPDWNAADLIPAIETAIDAFGPDRLLCGSDWPVSLLNNGDYEQIWDETRRALALVAPDHLDVMLSTTASRLYELHETLSEPVLAHGAH
jgi:L-fuconolactonase